MKKVSKVFVIALAVSMSFWTFSVKSSETKQEKSDADKCTHEKPQQQSSVKTQIKETDSAQQGKAQANKKEIYNDQRSSQNKYDTDTNKDQRVSGNRCPKTNK